mmetsp:Transcript_30151/g.65869  ORF Transcript_30151/g.65869 Transcript_30151/m.65869 type:complete len:356 (+) Transcript_30151:66-1133(+)
MAFRSITLLCTIYIPLASANVLRARISVKEQSCPPSSSTLTSLIYLKTRKTGSSTLANIVHRFGECRGWAFLLPENSAWLGWPGAFPGEENAKRAGPPDGHFNAIVNHAVFSESLMRSYVQPEPFFLSVVRDPVAQASSAYNYFFRAHGRKSWREQLDWLANALPSTDDIDASRFLNSQAHDFGWYEHVGQSKESDHDETRVQQWLSQLQPAFSDSGLVIINEFFDEGLVLLKHRLNLSLREVMYTPLKVSHSRKILPSEAEREELRSLSPVDTALYEHFNRSFWSAWQAAPRETLEADLAELRRLNRDLATACAEPRDVRECPPAITRDSREFTLRLEAQSRSRPGRPTRPTPI